MDLQQVERHVDRRPGQDAPDVVDHPVAADPAGRVSDRSRGCVQPRVARRPPRRGPGGRRAPAHPSFRDHSSSAGRRSKAIPPAAAYPSRRTGVEVLGFASRQFPVAETLNEDSAMRARRKGAWEGGETCCRRRSESSAWGAPDSRPASAISPHRASTKLGGPETPSGHQIRSRSRSSARRSRARARRDREGGRLRRSNRSTIPEGIQPLMGVRKAHLGTSRRAGCAPRAVCFRAHVTAVFSAGPAQDDPPCRS